MSVVTATSSVTGLPQAAALRSGAGDTVAPGTRVDATAGGAAANSSVTPPTEGAALSSVAQVVAALSPQQIAASIIGDAAARQNGLAPLYADLAALVKSGQALPAPVAALVRQLLAAPLDIASKSTVGAAEIKTALMQSGLAAAPSAAANAGAAAAMAAPQAQVAGLNLVLGLMRRALTNWRDDEQADTARTGTATVAANSGRALATDARQAPPPPFRNGPTVPQAPVEAALPEDVSDLALAQHLLDRTEAAIARQTLMQVASLSDGDAAAAKPGTDGRHLLFDIPMAMPQGTAVAQFRIERDGAGNEAEATKPAWRASFAIDIEPLGRVHAHIALVGDRTSVTLRAERPESAALFSDNVAQLEAALREAALEPGTLSCVGGEAPAQSMPAGKPGMFLDSKT